MSDYNSALIKTQIPDFIKIDHPTFVTFIEAYYEWLDSQETLRSSSKLSMVSDIDTTLDDFIDSFRSQFLLSFPESLAVNSKNGKPVDPKKLIKNIKQFYIAKGTEKTYDFLFRILYDTNVEFYYPKLDILRTSHGKWIQKKSIRISSSLGNNIFSAYGKNLVQYSSTGNIIASGIVDEISKYQLGSFEITEIFFSNINGTFQAGIPVQFESEGETYTESQVYSVVGSISISNSGANYRVGDSLVFVGNGERAEAKVSQVTSSGAILRIRMDNFGVNYTSNPTVTVASNSGTGFIGTANIGTLCSYAGYYANNDGKLSSNKYLQDNRYYQEYSYVLKTEITINKYRDILKKLLHPAGYGFFGQIQIKRCAEANLSKSTSLIRYEIPFIGNYAPYTPYTFDDLSQWFSIDGTTFGYDPNVHESVIEGAGGNPITNGIPFFEGPNPLTTIGFKNADPFWIVYQHPNKRVKGPVVAKILRENLDEISDWDEWQITGATERNEWISEFTGDYKYTRLKYISGESELRKITLRSFFSMPIGEEFDCRVGERGINHGIVEDHGPSPNF